MAINPGIPIPSAMPRVSLERADDGVDEDVEDCMTGNTAGPVIIGTSTITVVVEDAKLDLMVTVLFDVQNSAVIALTGLIVSMVRREGNKDDI